MNLGALVGKQSGRDLLLFRTPTQVNAKGNQRRLTRRDDGTTLRGEVKKNVSKNAINNNQQERRDRRPLTGKQVRFVQQYTDPESVGF